MLYWAHPGAPRTQGRSSPGRQLPAKLSDEADPERPDLVPCYTDHLVGVEWELSLSKALVKL